eukprot:CAMPEP_0119011924 /NCGR_PEP_ID=MMETSP1176-20130426/5971_1 /TAXON_ID=265551 /ORGANISM="Synedropsis recta cf, Strain CCMP1620" /LENGTH=305 /DNA_ID=CAMNT_0006964805 /DNA_START=34 /DNA_END=951 /DNA_ORIENTATION=-
MSSLLCCVLLLCSVSSIWSFSTTWTPPRTTSISTIVGATRQQQQHLVRRCRRSTTVFAGSSSSNTDDDTVKEKSSQRRFLLSFAFATATLPLDYLGLQQYKKHQQDEQELSALSTTTENSFVPVSNLNEAFQWIEKSVDPRFRHAVVATDYQSGFYQQGNKLGLTSQFLETPSSNDVFAELERNQLKDRPVLQPSQSQLLVSNIDVARKKWGEKNIVSVWPLGGEVERSGDSSSSAAVHYAWPEKGGVFLTDSSIIVDGIDCGRMSLEDALEGDMEVLVQAKQFLVIPLAMEEQLVQKLRGAFLM